MSEQERRIVIGRPHLPPLARFREGLAEIWERGWLTNEGPVLVRFAEALRQRLDSPELSLFCNGTLALQLGIQALELSGEVITTPFTFVATAHALRANGLRPVFVDIEPQHYTLDPARVEAAITSETSALLGVHVYGHPCRHAELATLADRHGLRLIYDAAHAFGVKVDGRTIAGLGDMSMFSFHATKLFHSIEGGLLVVGDPQLRERLDRLRNFGFESETEVSLQGSNAKMNELQALMGLLMLEELDDILEGRRRVASRYRSRLSGVPGIRLPALADATVEANNAYVPLEVFESEHGRSRDELRAALAQRGVIARPYFHPLVTDFSCYRDAIGEDPLEVARGVASRILTLPIHDDMSDEEVDLVCDVIADRTRGAST